MFPGKRRRAPMRRTTSMTEFSGILDKIHKNGEPTEVVSKISNTDASTIAPAACIATGCGAVGRRTQQFQQQQSVADWEKGCIMAMVSPRGSNVPRRNSGDFAVVMAHFLRACGSCKRRLAPGKDIFMYRGEIAFCSSECRQQRMTQDEVKGKCRMTSMKKETTPTNAAPETEKRRQLLDININTEAGGVEGDAGD